MRALTQQCKKVDLSVNYDGITIYPKFKVGGDPRLQLAIDKCNQIGLVIVQEPLTQDGKMLNEGCKQLKTSSNYDFNRFIHRNDDDHDYYHKDAFNENNNHSHLKFTHKLTSARCEQILDIFVSFDVLTEVEKNSFMAQLNLRYNGAKNLLKSNLTGDKKQDLAAISKFTESCGDNDILSYIHDYLSGSEFDYLRGHSKSYFFASRWQGIQNGNLEQTSHSWAMIEKGIALQLAKNVETNTKFTPKVASERAQQLKEDHAYFDIKRKTNPSNPTSKFFETFQNADQKSFDASYDKHFAPIRRR